MSMIDLDTWPRRATCALYRGYQQPWFSLTTEIEVGRARTWCRTHEASFCLAVWFAVLRAANEVEALRLRLRPGGVWRHECVRMGATALRPDQSLAFVYYPSAASFVDFEVAARAEVARRLADDALTSDGVGDDLLYGTVIPWHRFTSITHAHPGDIESGPESIPRIAVGRASPSGGGVRLPIAAEVHHALVDGLHLATFFGAVERHLSDPDALLGGA